MRNSLWCRESSSHRMLYQSHVNCGLLSRCLLWISEIAGGRSSVFYCIVRHLWFVEILIDITLVVRLMLKMYPSPSEWFSTNIVNTISSSFGKESTARCVSIQGMPYHLVVYVAKGTTASFKDLCFSIICFLQNCALQSFSVDSIYYSIHKYVCMYELVYLCLCFYFPFHSFAWFTRKKKIIIFFNILWLFAAAFVIERVKAVA